MNKISTKSKGQQGFNLIELMIVIAIIALLIGVGVPAWQSMTRSGNETAATQTLDAVRRLQVQYAAKHQGNFAPNFDELRRSVGFDEKFTGERPVVNGYIYTMKIQERTQSQPAFYSINADPQVSEGITATGTRHFYFDSTLSTIKSTEENRPAKADDPAI
jgi:prepilin-type N-terminal cleavage/methylation domain-containing protein